MTNAAKILWAVSIVIVAAAAIGLEFVPANDTGFSHAEHTTNAGELTRDVLVGQTFTAERDDLSGVSVLFATYSNRENTQPVRFHLRSAIDSRDDIRTSEVHPSDLRDNQLHTFSFEPVPDSKGKQFFFFLVSPQSTPGNAVTVDLDTRDPYHLGSAYVVRGQGPAVTDPAILARSGKPTTDVGFGLEYESTVRAVVVKNTVEWVRAFIGGWEGNRDLYLAFGRGFLGVSVVLVVIFLVHPRAWNFLTDSFRSRILVFSLLAILLLIGFGFRVMYGISLPVTNDEGNYLYDAVSIQRGVFAGGDGYVKAPLVIAWVALWQIFFGETVLAGRLASISAGILTLIPLYFLVRNLTSMPSLALAWSHQQKEDSKQRISEWGKRTGLVAAAMWAGFGAAIVFNIYVHTQPVALFFAISGISVLLAALRGKTPRPFALLERSGPSGVFWFLIAGVLLGLGVASRKSVLAVGLVPLLMILVETKGWRMRTRNLVSTGIGCLLMIGLFLGAAYTQYGEIGIWEAIGYNSAEDGITTVTEDEADQVRAYSLRGMTPFFRESLPLILLAVLGLGFSLEFYALALFKKLPKITIAWPHALSRLVWIIPWAVFIWAWQFFFEYEGAAFMRYGIPAIWWLFGAILVVATIWPDKILKTVKPNKEEALVQSTTQPGTSRRGMLNIHKDEQDAPWLTSQYATLAFIGPLWLLGLVVFYTNWIKFHANYISEFIPPLIVLSAIGAVGIFRRLRSRPFWHKDHEWLNIFRLLVLSGVVIVLAWSGTVSNYITYFFEHTGTFHQGSIHEAAAFAKETIPIDEPIFTGAAVVPYLSGHRTALDIAHPRWYAYEFTRKDTRRLNTFLPPIEDMLAAYRDAQWFLLDRQTGFSYLMEYSEIEAGLETDWEIVKEFENSGNTLVFYRRVQ